VPRDVGEAFGITDRISIIDQIKKICRTSSSVGKSPTVWVTAFEKPSSSTMKLWCGGGVSSMTGCSRCTLSQIPTRWRTAKACSADSR